MAGLYGSICLSDIPREQIKRVPCKDGVTRAYVNIQVIERKKTSDFGHTHFISCSPKKEEQKEGVNYFIGDLKPFGPSQPTTAEIDEAPSVGPIDDLPF